MHYLYHKTVGFFVKAILCSVWLVSLAGCNKYLDKKPQQNQAIPSSLSDLQAILDNLFLNAAASGFDEVVADNFYLTTASWKGATNVTRGQYIWEKEAPLFDRDWDDTYTAIYWANFVLDFLPEVSYSSRETATYNHIKGTALFIRAFYFHRLAQLFAPVYSEVTKKNPGIVIRTVSAVEAPSTRATVQQTYDQIIADVQLAASLLPDKALVNTRPCKAAAWGMLARAYLSMRDYTAAGQAADAALALNNTLLDYNTLSPVGAPVLPGFLNNSELLFLSYSINVPVEVMGPSHQALIDSTLYRSYDNNDLRKAVFFGANAGTMAGTYYWRGSYYSEDGTWYPLNGIVTDELYLIKAECLARAANAAAAMQVLNALLVKRWKTGLFNELVAADATEALDIILAERRKELLFRGLRWSDLRRLNEEGQNITLTRVVDGTTYSLPPGDLRWTLLIPTKEISRSKIPQNPR